MEIYTAEKRNMVFFYRRGEAVSISGAAAYTTKRKGRGYSVCAIAGFVNLPVSSEETKKMLDSMHRRGPDGQGAFREEGCTLLHARLSIIDPASGKQPMQLSFAGEEYTIVYNGEIYNTAEVRHALEKEGHCFEGYSDTEVVLHAYAQFGERCVGLLNGIFAFAVWEQKRQRLFLARDRIGVKPLFYAQTGGGLLFASESKTLLCYHGLKPALDAQGAYQLLLLGPGRIPGSGVFCGIREVEPGWCGYYRERNLSLRRYWKLRDRPHTDTLEETCEKVRTLVTDAIRRQMVSDVPIGTFLSGGLDSTLALLVAVRALDLLGRPRTDMIAVTMPGFGTTHRTRSNAELLCEKLGVTLRTVSIAAAVRQHFKDIGHDESVADTTYENAQARERTQVLMDIANKENALVIGTGDMSELALGWATYNGDHMSMYGVNASVPKTLVRHLVRYCADTADSQTLKETLLDILDTPVSPELIPPEDGQISQKTEDLVGPYELHDFFLYHILRFGRHPAKVYRLALKAFEGVYDAATILRWLKTFYRRFFAQQFKRSCLPDGPKVGSVAVSPRGDLRMPSDACVTLWMQELDEIVE